MLDPDERETMRLLEEMERHASPSLRRKLGFIARNIRHRDARIRDMRDALMRAKRNQDIDEIKDIEDWAFSHKNYQDSRYEKDG